MPEKKTLNEDLFYKGSSASLPRLHTCENKAPFWDKSKFFASQNHYTVFKQMIDIKLNYQCLIGILETIYLYAKSD